jgi:hypothetical protein
MNRRALLRLTLSLPVLQPFARGAFADETDGLAEFARQLIFTLVPQEDLSGEFYAQLAARQLATEPTRERLLRLRDLILELAGGTELDPGLSLPERLNHPDMIQLRNWAASTVYTHPDTFAATGYGGSSLEFGGYLQRGFNDIDWLPSESNP